MSAWIIFSVALLMVVALIQAFRPRKKLTANKENGWQNPNSQKLEKGGSLANSPPESSGYLGGGD